MTRRSALDRLCDRAGIETTYIDDWQRRRQLSSATKRALLEALSYDTGSSDAINAALRDSDRSPSPTVVSPNPSRCYLPPRLRNGGRVWGIAAQLYGLRSERNWGIGDFTDLARLVDLAGDLGAAAVGLNPLHALFPGLPERASPYAGSSRQFLNILYIDVEAIDDFMESAEARETVAAPAFQERLRALRAEALVDYDGVAACKIPVLDLLYRSFRKRHLRPGAESARGRAFRDFVAERGAVLECFAAFEALWERFARERGFDWRMWPESYRRPDSPDVTRFAREQRERIDYFAYLQWQADIQLRAAAERARTHGLPIGLYVDLAIGTAGDGADTWIEQDFLADGVSVGAPPDRWNPTGQNWGLKPFNPDRLRESACVSLARVFAANMRHAGALRIDHVLGLKRLYWIPHGQASEAGGYIRYPFADILSVLAEESHRHNCVVVGEDLGTMPEGIREHLESANVFSYRVLYFERNANGAFMPPSSYPRLAVATVTTHDLPTLAGYWVAHDIDLRARLGLFSSPDMERESRACRDRDRAALVDALRAAGALPPGSPTPEKPNDALVDAVYRFVASTQSLLAMTHLEDILLTTDQPNLPATPDAAPNWRRKLDATIEELARDPRLHRLADLMKERRA